jgi:hypothetical protein
MQCNALQCSAMQYDAVECGYLGSTYPSTTVWCQAEGTLNISPTCTDQSLQCECKLECEFEFECEWEF